jgi:hypothetical protein
MRPSTRVIVQWLLGPSILVVVAVVTFGGGLTWFEARLTEPAPHFATLDELSIPSSWEDVHSVYTPSLLFGSWVARYYLVDADPDDLVEPVLRMIEDANWEVDPPRPPRDMCSTNGSGGPMTCILSATVGGNSARIVISDRNDEGTYYFDDQESRSAPPGRSMVRVTISY